MPVVLAKLEYLKPAFYDDILIINTSFKIVEAKLVFYHQILNDRNELINVGEIRVVCIDSNTRKPIKPIKEILNI